MKAVVIGYGSIGQRHARLLSELGCSVAVVSHHPVDFFTYFSDVPSALIHWNPNYVVIANRTCDHYQSLMVLIQSDFKGAVMIEKPLFQESIRVLPSHAFSHATVAYNLRCSPLLLKLKSILKDESKLLTAVIYVGSYLPDWRPNSDYRQSYSAKKDEGGGVLRDLSHELDYVNWLFGPWVKLTSIGGHISQLEIDSDDTYSLLMKTKRCPLISIHMNYLDREPKREIHINTDKHSIHADLINNKLTIDSTEEIFNVKRDDTYIAEHIAMLEGNLEQLCTLKDGLETIKTIEAIEQAANLNTWIQK